jgi:hypothetical protein
MLFNKRRKNTAGKHKAGRKTRGGGPVNWNCLEGGGGAGGHGSCGVVLVLVVVVVVGAPALRYRGLPEGGK